MKKNVKQRKRMIFRERKDSVTKSKVEWGKNGRGEEVKILYGKLSRNGGINGE